MSCGRSLLGPSPICTTIQSTFPMVTISEWVGASALATPLHEHRKNDMDIYKTSNHKDIILSLVLWKVILSLDWNSWQYNKI